MLYPFPFKAICSTFVLLGFVASALKFDLRPYYYVLGTCNQTGRFPPTIALCVDYARATNPYLADLLLTETLIGFTWVQLFAVPRSGLYTLTLAGAGGGEGACSRTPGRGAVIRMSNLNLSEELILSLFVGQKGTSACTHAPTHPVCQLNETARDFEDRCVELLLNSTLPQNLMLEGGGGGGGETHLFVQSGVTAVAMATAAGGGGASALPSSPASRGNADATIRAPSNSLRRNGVGISDLSAGAGGSLSLTASRLGTFRVDGNQEVAGRNLFFAGGENCLVGPSADFPSTAGGSGGGGGGCGNGGGGGGWWGGNVSNSSTSNFPGQGGIYFANGFLLPEFIGFNPGDGYATLLFDKCSCVYKCIPDFDNEMFECACPDGVSLAPNGMDCIRSQRVQIEPLVEPNSIQLDGSRVFTNLLVLNETVSVYSISVNFSAVAGSTILRSSPGALGSSCMLLLVDPSSNVVGSSEIVRVDPLSEPRSSQSVLDLSKGDFNSSLSSPLRVSAVDLISLDVLCQASFAWIISLEKRTPTASVDTALLALAQTLPLISTACEAGSECSTLDMYPPPVLSEQPNVALAISLGIVVPALVIVVILLACLIVLYVRHRRGKYKVLAGITEEVHVSFDHYQVMYVSQHKPDQSTLEQDRTRRNQFKVNYINENDRAYGALRTLRPKYGVEQCSSVVQRNESWLYPREELTFVKKMGEGQFGEVMLMLGSFKNATDVPVAVKLLQSEEQEDQSLFFDEIELMKSLRHANIVSLLGYCEEELGALPAPPLMILEYIALGDLLNLLIANKPKPDQPSGLTNNHLCSFAVDVARALQYLSEMSYVHRDVAARNVLVSTNLTAKLADFGLAQQLNAKAELKISPQEKLPLRWMPPEVITRRMFDAKSDVWSYGILLWEISTFGDFPHNDKDIQTILNFAISGKIRLDPPSNCVDILKTLIAACQNVNSSSRPTFSEIIELFHKYAVPM